MREEQEKYNLPEGWINVSLGDILILEYGKSLPKNNRQDGKYPIFGSNGIIGYHNEFLVEGPAIIIGRKGSVGSVHVSNENCWPIDTTYYIKPTLSLNFKFVFFILKVLNLSKLDKSTTIPGLNRDNIYEQIIGLPPLNEQNRIVLKIEEILSSIEKGEDQLKLILNKLEGYKKLILRRAFEGRLTNDWKDANKSISDNIVEMNSLKGHLTDLKFQEISIDNTSIFKSAKILGEVSEKEMSNLIGLPNSWIWLRLKDISYDISYGFTEKSHIKPVGPKFLRITDIQNNTVDWKSVPYCKISDNKKSKYLLKDGDLLFARTGATVGKSYLIKSIPNEAVFASYLIRVRLAEKINQNYISYFFQSELYWKQIIKNKAGVAQPNVNGTKLSNLFIPLPLKKEQDQVVKVLDNLMSICDKIELSINQNLHLIKIANQSLLKKAFQGKIIDRDPNDELVNSLIERIRKEKEDYLNQLKEEKKSTPKIKAMPDIPKNILQILNERKESVSASELWSLSDKKDDIDGFYAELKKHIDEGFVIEEKPRKGKVAFLKLVDNK